MGLLGNLIGKVVNGVKNLITNAKAGKAALSQGFVPGATTPVNNNQGQNSTTGTPDSNLPWYKQVWVIPLGIGLFILMIIVIIFSFFGGRRR